MISPKQFYSNTSCVKVGLFSVNSLFGELKGGSAAAFQESMLWNLCVPSKVSFFACKVWWGKMITLNQLKRRGCALANKRSLCSEDEKNIEHILLPC